MRTTLLATSTLAATCATIGHAYYLKQQFYPTVVYVTKSNVCMAVLYVQAFVFAILLAKIARRIFFSTLRASEIEHLYERSWFAITETCLAFTVFREDFNPLFVANFTLLLFVKTFHWLGEDRVDYMERSPAISALFHIRMISLVLCLGVTDTYFIRNAYHATVQSGASVQIVFGFEYAILLALVMTIAMKYALHVIDLQHESPWENKTIYILHTELVTNFIRVALYSLFFIVMVKIHAFPLFAIRPLYLALRSFKKSLNDIISSRRAIASVMTRCPDVTPEELANMDNVCIICREEMTTDCKKLPCNHVFHISCLRSWFQRQQTCPTCRMNILRATMQQPEVQQRQQERNTQQNQQDQQAAPNVPNVAPPQFFAALFEAAQNAQNQQNQQNGNNEQPQWPAFFPPFPGQQPNAPQVPPEGQTGSSDSSATATADATNTRSNITNGTTGNVPPFFLPGMPGNLPFPMPPPPPLPAIFLGNNNNEPATLNDIRQDLNFIRGMLDSVSERIDNYISKNPATTAADVSTLNTDDNKNVTHDKSTANEKSEDEATMCRRRRLEKFNNNDQN